MTDELDEKLTPQQMFAKGAERIENRRQLRLRAREEFAERIGDMSYDLHVARKDRDHYRRMFEQRHCWVLAEMKEVDRLKERVRTLEAINSHQSTLLSRADFKHEENTKCSSQPS